MTTNTTATKGPQGYTIKGFKTFIGMEGRGFNLTLYKDGRKVAFVVDDAHGADFDWQYFNKADREELEAKVKELPQHELDMGDGTIEMMDPFPDGWLSDLIEAYEEDKFWRGKCRKSIIFTLTDCKDGAYYEIKNTDYAANRERITKVLKERHGAKLLEIVNERYV
jgi:hypothetical protein